VDTPYAGLGSSPGTGNSECTGSIGSPARLLYRTNSTLVFISGKLEGESEYQSQSAIKVIDKKKFVTNEELDRALFELKVMRLVAHPHIIQCLWSDETTDSISFITPLAVTDLHALTNNRIMPESTVKQFVIQLLTGLDYLHAELSVIHNDIKPHNILVYPHSSLRICDFGFSQFCAVGRFVHPPGIRGTPGYFAPEQMRGEPYNHSIDVFSLGVILYQLISGYEPFYPHSVVKHLTHRRIEFHSPYWDGISPDCIQFIRKCLEPDGRARTSAASARVEKWTL